MFASNNRSFIASSAIPIYTRVKLTTPVNGEAAVAIAGATEDYIGITETPIASGRAVSVRLKNSGGTVYMTAATSFAANASVYGVANGQVDDVASGNVLAGTALVAATGTGSIVEVLLP
jgi:Uncharacterized conserved protein (DUF2190)